MGVCFVVVVVLARFSIIKEQSCSKISIFEKKSLLIHEKKKKKNNNKKTTQQQSYNNKTMMPFRPVPNGHLFNVTFKLT